MTRRISPFEILTMAEQIEQRGADFYRDAAHNTNDERLRALFLQLLDWELDHKKIFARMRQEFLQERESRSNFNPARYMTSDPRKLRSMAEAAAPDQPPESIAKMTEKAQVLQLALGLEKRAIRFYKKLIEGIRNVHAKKRIKAILDEEAKHVDIITQALEQA